MYKDECKWKEKNENLKETIKDKKRSDETIKNVYEEKTKKKDEKAAIKLERVFLKSKEDHKNKKEIWQLLTETVKVAINKY